MEHKFNGKKQYGGPRTFNDAPAGGFNKPRFGDDTKGGDRGDRGLRGGRQGGYNNGGDRDRKNPGGDRGFNKENKFNGN